VAARGVRTPHAVVHVSDDTEVLSLFVPSPLMERAWRIMQPRPPIDHRVLVGARIEIARGLALAWGEQRYADRRPDALQRRCAAALGLSPSELLIRARVERAIDLLGDPSRPLGDVGLACGFATQAHFSTVFKARTGLSPSQWRRERRTR
jgi:AraC-like DNA-binding protein